MKSRAPVPVKPLASHGLARVLSKRGLASRTQAALWIRDGRVSVDGRVVTDPEYPVRAENDTITVDGRVPSNAGRLVVMLNKPRGLVTTVSDERGRDTVYRCFAEANLPWLAPVGRLDKASEGLLLFTNDPAWAARITDPTSATLKTYHVQVGCVPDDGLVVRLMAGATVDGERLGVRGARVLRRGGRHGWLEIVLDEGRNRHLRRLLAAFDVSVLRLIRVAIGELVLGPLAKGAWRVLTDPEVAALSPSAGAQRDGPAP